MPLEQSSTSSSEAMSLLKTRLSKFETEEGRLAGLSYQPKSADEIIISTTPKAGTTWVQQICHQLRSGANGGDMSFEEISAAVPWLELAHDQGQDLYAPQYGDSEGLPRLFKSHAWEEHCPKGCKVIVVVRDPLDVLASFYNFFQGWFFEDGTVTLDDFADEFWLARAVPKSRMNNASYFVHLVSWYKRRNDDNVLFVFYEDLKEDLGREVQRIAEFMSTSEHDFTKAKIIQTAVYMSSFEFMSANKSHFDEKLSKLARNESCGLPRTAGLSKGKLHKGTSGSGKQLLSDELKSKVDVKWKEVVQPITGCESYEELRKAMHNERPEKET